MTLSQLKYIKDLFFIPELTGSNVSDLFTEEEKKAVESLVTTSLTHDETRWLIDDLKAIKSWLDYLVDNGKKEAVLSDRIKKAKVIIQRIKI